ncbi:thyroid transcription factor 1-associated protein 26 homolog isoform X2 [Dunckerocampus dactyliophorus]|uniref:thyroid transcription factor 1-associated protein 26 homolog isoform X2 n=1 Tax=Dunckerocampus dactyliophorus TaxID=161453 RepID=UPI0024060C37|nr:thyroid transcription factor 1-associated protein 26 homolog isoform X2 [Dunckerocampus dactyliophorus]
MKTNTLQKKEVNWKKSIKQTDGVKKKKKWVPQNKVFRGSVNEGKGFALKRKEKVQHEYNKLLRKEQKKKTTPQTASLYREEYPEHLKHLYMAEAEKLKSEAWTNRANRAKLRMKGRGREAETEDDATQAQAQEPETAAPDPEGPPETADTAIEKTTSAAQILPMSNRMKKKMLMTTSFQRSKEEYEKAKEKRRKKKEEYLMNKQQREEAIRKYKQRKVETFQMLCKKTKKGQPNLNLQMDYLLQKLQKNSERP